MEHGARKHSIYGASAAYRRFLCPGSVRLTRALPEFPSNPFQRDGQEAHELLDYALKNGYWNAKEASIMAGRYELDSKPEAGDRFNAVNVALHYVQDILEAYEDAVLYVEHFFEMPSNVTDQGWGWNDIAIHVPSLSLVYIIDYKHGAGVGVDHIENKQLLQYGTGAVLGSGHMDADTIVLVIIQPRCFHPAGSHPREWVVGKDRLEAFVEEFDTNVIECEDPNAPLIPGETQCHWCPAAFTCPAREAKALQIVRADFKTVKDITQANLPDPATLPMDRIAYIKAAKKYLLDWLADVDDIAFRHAMGGGYVPDHKLVEARAYRRWYGDPKEVNENLKLLAGVDDDDVFFPRTLKGITETEDMLVAAFRDRAPKGKKKQAAEDAVQSMAALTIKESSGNLSLVHISDRRPAVDRAAQTFKTVQSLPAPTMETDK